MKAKTEVLAVVPARGGSKGLAGKNIRPFAGIPLIAHSILFARLCPEIGRVVVSTDSAEIAVEKGQFSVAQSLIQKAKDLDDTKPAIANAEESASSVTLLAKVPLRQI